MTKDSPETIGNLMQAERGLAGIAEGHSLSDEVMHADAMLNSSVKEETRESFSPFR